MVSLQASNLVDPTANTILGGKLSVKGEAFCVLTIYRALEEHNDNIILLVAWAS